MLRFILPLALFCVFSCSKEQPPTAPAGKKNCDFCDLFDTFRRSIGRRHCVRQLLGFVQLGLLAV